MTAELLRLFSEGGGKDALAKLATVRQGSPNFMSAAPWLPVGEILARADKDSLVFAMAQTLAMAEAQSSQASERFVAVMRRAQESLQRWGKEVEDAALCLLEVKDKLQEKFGVTAWEAYWMVLARAFRTGASPLALAQAMVRALGDAAA